MESLFVNKNDKNWNKWQGPGSLYIVCPICGRGNGTVHFLKETYDTPYQDTVICYDCLSFLKTDWIDKHPKDKSVKYKHLNKEEIKLYMSMLDKETFYHDI